MSNTGFTPEEKRRFFIRKYIKEHIFDFVLSLVKNILLVGLVLYFCEGRNYALGALLAAAYTAGKGLYSLRYYRRDYLNPEISEEK